MERMDVRAAVMIAGIHLEKVFRPVEIGENG